MTGTAPPQTDLNQLVDGRFALGSARSSQLFSTQPPVNSSFLLTARVELPQLSPEEQQRFLSVISETQQQTTEATAERVIIDQ